MGGRDQQLGAKAKDETSRIASKAESLAEDAQTTSKEAADKVKSKFS